MYIVIMKTTHTRISENGIVGLDYLCGLTGDNRRDTIDRVVAFAIKKEIAFRERKKYEEVLSVFESKLSTVITK
jgi:hypothetical protein